MSTKRVLLTGAAGFLGSHALRHFLDRTDWEMVCPVSFEHRGLPERLTLAVDGDQWDRVAILRCDLSAPIHDTTRARLGRVDAIINYASESHVDRSIRDPVPFVRNNVDLMLSMLEYARNVEPEIFVHISTDEVYGPAPRGYQHKEWDPVLPSNPYSASKAAQEALGIAYWRTYHVPLVLINCMNLIGETQDPEKYLAKLIKHIILGEEVPIHATRDGTIGSRYYLHASELADAALFLINRGSVARVGADARPDRWNVVGDREVDNYELAQMVADLLGNPLKSRLVDFSQFRPGHDLRYALDGAKLDAAGWRRNLTFEEALRRIASWSVNHPEWALR